MSQQPTAVPVPVESEAAPAADDANNKKKKKGKGGKKAVSGIQTMFRVTYQNHIQLSQLADNKANMLISINGLMTSVLAAALAPRIEQAIWLLTPAIVLLAGCVPSLVFAVLTVRPRLNRTPITVEQVRANAGNLLFFGQFSGMPLAEFNESMHALIDNPRLLQDSLIRQLWLMGQSLKQKYRFLQIAYGLFLLGVGGAGVVLVVQLIARFSTATP